MKLVATTLTVIDLKDTGHWLMEERPKETMDALIAFLWDAGFVFNMPRADAELVHIPVALQHVELAVPKGHPLTKLKKLRLRDLADASFV
jgi:DNA-binding transcriptional LysR family regulator